MDLRRLRAGEWIAAASGAVLIGSLFLPWYGRRAGSDLSGWEALEIADIVFAATGLAGIALVVVTASQKTVAVPVTLDTLAVLLGGVVSVLALVRLLDLPEAASERLLGPYVALAACLGFTAGSAIAMHDERLGEGTDATGRPGPSSPPVERRPAPPPEGTPR